MSAIPGRLKIAAASWIFIAASVFLIAEFILVGYGPHCMATWFLILTNAVGYFDGRSGSANPSWWAPCQVIGASLLLVGSIIYAAWAHLPPKDGMPLVQ